MPRSSPAQARERFAAARVARLATVAASGAPHLVPCTFALVTREGGADELISAVDDKPKATAALARLDHIAADPRVSLLVDHYDEDWSTLWWARADGRAAVLDPPPGSPERARHLAPLIDRYAPYRERPPVGPIVVVSVRRWSGWSAS